MHYSNTLSGDYEEIPDIFFEFPRVWAQAKKDWILYQQGVGRGLFTNAQKAAVQKWFGDFPKYWETVRPNFLNHPDGRPRPDHSIAYARDVDNWVASLRAKTWNDPLLGEPITLIVIAGILIIGGIAAALWAVGYIKEQSNISNVIEQTVAGKLPPEAVVAAYQAQEAAANNSPFGNISEIVKWGAIAALVLLGVPLIAGVVRGK